MPPPFPANLPPTVDGYKKGVEDQLGPIWYSLVKEYEGSLRLGTVTLRFVIPAAGGNPQDIKVAPTTAGAVDEAVAITAVRSLRLPAIPEPLLQSLPQRRFFFEESFTIYLKGSPSPSPAPKR
jgi:hypothetical protein